MKKLKSIILAICLIAAMQNVARADVALGFTGGGRVTDNALLTIGWAFTLSAPVVVTDLGYFDDGDDGLAVAHPVGVWTSGGVPLLQATVPVGTAGTLLNGFRYVAVRPTLLLAGNYTIGGCDPNSTDKFVIAATITTAAGITYDGSRSVNGQPLTFPPFDEFMISQSYFGPNFQFAVPEPTPAGTPVMGGGSLLCGRLATSTAWAIALSGSVMRHTRPNQSMKPTQHFVVSFRSMRPSVFKVLDGLSLSR